MPDDKELTKEKDPLLAKSSVQESDEEINLLTYSHWQYQHRLPPGKSSLFGATFIVVNAALGAGLLAFPFAFQAAGGILPAVAITAVSSLPLALHNSLALALL